MYYNNILQNEIVNYIIRCQQEGDWEALGRLGLTKSQANTRSLIKEISEMSTSELNFLSNSVEEFISVQVNAQTLRKVYRSIHSIQGGTTPDPDVPSQDIELLGCLCGHVASLYQGHQGQSLRKLGLSSKAAGMVSMMPVSKVRLLAASLWDFVRIRVNRKHMYHAVKSSVSTCNWFNQCGQLVQAGAPRELMQRYYGMSSNMYALAREMHGENHKCGRPRALPNDVQCKIYREFVRQYHRHSHGVDPLRDPRFFLDMYQNLQCTISLREVWTLAQSWLDDQVVFRNIKRQAFTYRFVDEEEQPDTAPSSDSEDKASKPPSNTFSDGT